MGTKRQQPSSRKKKSRDGTEIAYQNKDIISKLFGESLKGKSLSVYGIKNSRIKDVRPTNLPLIEANELRLDNLFLMEDGAYAIVDYESEYSEENKSKYLDYIARVSRRLYLDLGSYQRIRMIVIYTADIEPGSTEPVMDLGAFSMHIEEAFLTGVDSEKIKRLLSDKINSKAPFTDEDMMKLIIYPLTVKGRANQQRAVSEAVDIAERLREEIDQRTALSGIFVFSDKIITDDDAERITRRLDMTKIGRLLQEREDKAVNKAVAEAKKEAKKEKKDIAVNFLKTGVSEDKVASCTGLSLKEVQALAAKV